MFVLNSEITIGKFSFSGVNEVKIEKSLHSFREFATVIIPHNINVIETRINQIRNTTPDKEFKEGDEVIVNLGYNGDLKEEFKGFVKAVNVTDAMSCAVECEGYSWQLVNKSYLKESWQNIGLKVAVEKIIKGTDITADVTVDIPLSGTIKAVGNGATVLSDILEKCCHNYVTAFFIEPKKLWVGLRYAAYRNDVKFTNGLNCIKVDFQDDNKQQRDVNIALHSQMPDGKKRKATVITAGRSERYIRLNHITDVTWLKKLAAVANEKTYHKAFRIKVNAFIQPYALPGDKIILSNPKQPERDGEYIIDAIKITYGMNGARRTIEAEARVGDVPRIETAVEV